MQKSQKEYLTPPMIARRLGVTNEKVAGWIKRGQLKASNISDGKINPRYVVHPDDLQAFLDARVPTPESPPNPVGRPPEESKPDVPQYV